MLKDLLLLYALVNNHQISYILSHKLSKALQQASCQPSKFIKKKTNKKKKNKKKTQKQQEQKKKKKTH